MPPYSFDRILEEFTLSVGGHVGYWQGSPKLIMDDAIALRPTLFVSVPRILERIADGGEGPACPCHRSGWVVTLTPLWLVSGAALNGAGL